VRVAVVITEVGRGIGGRYTFQEMLLGAVDRLRAKTTHQFIPYSAGISRHTRGRPAWRARRMAQVAISISVQASRHAQDALLGKRLLHIRTPLQRRLEADGIDLVWFPTTYVEDIDLPFACTIFDLEHRTKPWFPELSRRGEFERRERLIHRYLPKATRVIVPSQTSREQVVHFYGVAPENCITLAHPTPDFALRAAAAPKSDVDTVCALGVTPPYLFYPAQFWPHKNHIAALDTLVETQARGEELSLVLVGSDQGRLESVRRQVRDRGLERSVRILGFVDERTLVALYQHAHCLLYLSRFGPENLPPLEALALGCPVVVGFVPGVHEQLGEAALIVDPADPKAIADAVQHVGRPAERARLARAGEARARSWTADDYVRGLIAFLDTFEAELRLWK
jgi:glycosyltransferase involved in cell wall biosynthesis